MQKYVCRVMAVESSISALLLTYGCIYFLPTLIFNVRHFFS